MAELDFSKIFGETATSKASFTDENYLNGWGYLGSTPPPYQLFDYLQSLNDKKSKYLYDKTIENDNKLSLHNTNATAHADIRSKITSDINSHNSNTSAHTDIRSKITSDINSHNTNATAHKPILDMINGNQTALTETDNQIKSVLNTLLGTGAWNTPATKNIANIINLLGVGGIVAQRLETNGYVKFANNLIVQWGSTSDVDRDVTITFPIQFSTQCFCGMVTAQKSSGNLSGSQCNPAVRPASTTGMVAIMYDNTNTGWYWLAIGI